MPIAPLRCILIGVNETETFPFLHVAYSTSGKQDAFNFLNGTMGYANAQRTLNYIRIFTEFISQPEYVNLIPMVGVIDDPVGRTIGRETLASLCVAVRKAGS